MDSLNIILKCVRLHSTDLRSCHQLEWNYQEYKLIQFSFCKLCMHSYSIMISANVVDVRNLRKHFPNMIGNSRKKYTPLATNTIPKLFGKILSTQI